MAHNRPKIFSGFTNIRVLPSGYQVTITRAKVEVSRHFAGHSARSLRAAVKFRDQLLRDMPNKRLNPIPQRVLRAAGLKEAPPGVFRRVPPGAYVVNWYERGRLRGRQFGFQRRPEMEAFLQAVKFRKRIEAAAG
ncbi:MAG: hypothetical protein ACXV97_01155 [Chthoniobacterales bacterium]